MTAAFRNMATAIGLLALALSPVSALAEAPHPQIVVTGEGTVSVAPDMARVSIGVVHRADTAADALDRMNADVQAVLDRLTAFGIEKRHMQTGGLNLHQVFEHYDDRRHPAGYEASSNLDVQVHDLPALGKVLDAVVRDGANELRGLTFDLSDPAPYMDEARKNAVADARNKADLYSQAAGVNLGGVLLISEGGQVAAPQRMMMEASYGSAKSSAVAVAEGEMEITATINMIWSID